MRHVPSFLGSFASIAAERQAHAVRQLEQSLQDSIVAIDRQAIDAQPVASRRRVRKLENCRSRESTLAIGNVHGLRLRRRTRQLRAGFPKIQTETTGSEQHHGDMGHEP
jgi:hypothetical protein